MKMNNKKLWTNIHQLALAKLIDKSHTLMILTPLVSSTNPVHISFGQK
jgi:hypothetical protein